MKMKAPNPNIQAPMKLQTSNTKKPPTTDSFDIGAWRFTGCWSLGLGVFFPFPTALALFFCSAPNVRAQWFDQGAVFTATEEPDLGFFATRDLRLANGGIHETVRTRPLRNGVHQGEAVTGASAGSF
jgi:hypothetical protein